MKLYAGETLSGSMVLSDDNNEPITDLSSYDIKLLLRNKYDDYQVLLNKQDLSISGAKIEFSFSAEQTSQLKQIGVFELKVTKNGIVEIAKEDSFCIIDNKIKDL